MKHLEIDWWVIAILVLAIVVRGISFGAQPAGTYWDETAIWADARALVATGRDIHGLPGWQLIFPSYGDYKMPVLIWLSAASIGLFGNSIFALRLPSLLAGIITVFLTILLAKRLWPKRPLIAYLAGLAIALAPWSIIFSKTAFEGHVAQCLLAAAAWCLLHSKKGLGWIIAGTILGVVATYTYFSVRFVWPAVVLATLFVVSTEQIKTLKTASLRSLTTLLLKQLIVPLLGFALLLLPMMRAPFYAESNQFRLNADSVLKMQDWPIVSNRYRELAGNTPIDRGIFHRNWLMGQELLANYADHLDLSYLFLYGDSNLRHGTGQHGLFLWFWLPAFMAGIIVLWYKQPLFAAALSLWWLVALLPASVPENTPHALRSLNALVPISLMIGFGAEWLVTSLHHNVLSVKLRGIYLSILIALLGLQIGEFLLYYHTSYQQAAKAAWQTGFKQTISVVLNAAKIDQPVLIEHGDEKIYLWHLTKLDFKQAPQLTEQQFQMKKINQVSYGQITPAAIQASPHALTLTKPSKLIELQKQIQQTPVQLTTLSDASGEYILAQWP